jgi:hypothetical protein
MTTGEIDALSNKLSGLMQFSVKDRVKNIFKRKAKL